jgi:hypothetical protein
MYHSNYHKQLQNYKYKLDMDQNLSVDKKNFKLLLYQDVHFE